MLRSMMPAGVCLAFGLALLPATAPAVEPTGGTLTPANPSLTFAGTDLAGANVGVLVLGGDPCFTGEVECQTFNLKVDLPEGYVAAHPGTTVKITLDWGSAGNDYDFYVVTNPGAEAVTSAESADKPEIAEFPAQDGVKDYYVDIVPFTVLGESFSGLIELIPGTGGGGGGGGGDGGGDPAEGACVGTVCIGGPQFAVYPSPPGKADSAGEPTLDVNRNSGRVFFIAGLEVDRVTFDDSVSPPTAVWEEVTGLLTSLDTSDPILVGDPDTGRIWAAQLILAAGNSLQEYTDDDGETWLPSQGGGIRSGADHQGLGVGPYPAEPPGSLIPHPLYPNALYYCSQDIATAFCSRSDDGGQTFGPGVPLFVAGGVQCDFGLHGHPKVAPDGVVYVPHASCGGEVAVIVSEDAGMTWSVRPVPGTATARWDPSVGTDAAGTVYVGFMEEGDDRPKIVSSQDRGLTWSDPVDVGAPYGLANAVFPAVVGGDAGRVAFFFLGTTTAGDSGDPAAMGLSTPDAADDAHWYPFVATTLDGGLNWNVRNVSPDDPVQRGDIDDGGFSATGSDAHRNLLDFNDATVDGEGRILAAFADGCTGLCAGGGPNGFTADGVIVRQLTGKRLYAAFDPPELPQPGRVSLSGFQDAAGVRLSWVQPLSGDAPITYYNVYRGSGTEDMTLLAQVSEGTTFIDAAAAEGAYVYQVSAVNEFGEGQRSERLVPGPAPDTETICAVPGVTLLRDLSGDATAPGAAFDFEWLRVAEPDILDGLPSDTLTFTFKVAGLSEIPPGQRWLFRFLAPKALPAGSYPGEEVDGYWMGMTTEEGFEPRFAWGTTGVAVVGGVAGTRVFEILGDLEAGSGYDADGTITLVFRKSNVGLDGPGDAMSKITPAVRAVATPQNYGIWDDAGEALYVLRAINACSDNQLPVASLVKSAEAVTDDGVTVSLDASASSDPDGDGITQYVFDMTDGSPLIAQGNPLLIHTFAGEAGTTFRPRVQVFDSRGGASTNAAFVQVEIGGETSPTPTPTASGAPTPTPTPTASGAPTPTPTPTASGEPTPSPTASIPPTASPTPGPTATPLSTATPAPGGSTSGGGNGGAMAWLTLLALALCAFGRRTVPLRRH